MLYESNTVFLSKDKQKSSFKQTLGFKRAIIPKIIGEPTQNRIDIHFMTLRLCLKYETSTEVRFSKDIEQKPFSYETGRT